MGMTCVDRFDSSANAWYWLWHVLINSSIKRLKKVTDNKSPELRKSDS